MSNDQRDSDNPFAFSHRREDEDSSDTSSHTFDSDDSSDDISNKISEPNSGNAPFDDGSTGFYQQPNYAPQPDFGDDSLIDDDEERGHDLQWHQHPELEPASLADEDDLAALDNWVQNDNQQAPQSLNPVVTAGASLLGSRSVADGTEVQKDAEASYEEEYSPENDDLFDDEDDDFEEDVEEFRASDDSFDEDDEDDYEDNRGGLDDVGSNDGDDWDLDEDEPAAPWWQTLPLGMIALAVVALLLLAIGGIGVMQERSSLQEQIRDLQSRLAVAVSPDQLASERDVRRELSEHTTRLAEQLKELKQDNDRLTETIRNLETRLADGTAKPAASTVAPVSAPVTKPAPTSAPAPAATTSTGPWFVNFGSYSQRSLAEHWAKRLQPDSGQVVVNSIPDSNLYRVRIIGLADRSSAEAVARTLQQRYDLPKLWVGED